MPIASRDELVSLLRQVPGLHEFNRDIMIDTAFFMRDGSLGSLYMRLMIETCPFGQIDEFFRSARAFMKPNYGNPDDEEVFYPYRATGLDPQRTPVSLRSGGRAGSKRAALGSHEINRPHRVDPLNACLARGKADALCSCYSKWPRNARYLQSQSSSSAGRQFLLRVPFSEPFVEQAFHKLVNGCRYRGLAGTVTLALSQRDAEHLCRRLLVRCKPKHFQCRSEFVRGHRHQ